MSSSQAYYISSSIERVVCSERAIALLEVAMLSVIVLSLFTVVMAMTERVGLYNYTNQILENELQSQRQSLVLASAGYSQAGIDRQLQNYNAAITAQLQSRGIKSSEYQLETAFVAVRNLTFETETLSLDRAGRLPVTNFNASAVAGQYYASMSLDTDIFNSGLVTSFLPEQTNSNNLSTKLIISRLLIKQDRNVFRFLKYAGLENQVLAQKIIPLRLDYRL